MLLIVGGFISLILFIAILIFVLRIFSVTLFHIPGFDLFFEYIIILIPYILFFSAYYYLYKKITISKSKASRIIARILIAMGCIISLFTLSLSTALFLNIKNDWLRLFEDNSHYAMVIQIIIIFLTAGALASGDPKEKDWMERKDNL